MRPFAAESGDVARNLTEVVAECPKVCEIEINNLLVDETSGA